MKKWRLWTGSICLRLYKVGYYEDRKDASVFRDSRQFVDQLSSCQLDNMHSAPLSCRGHSHVPFEIILIPVKFWLCEIWHFCRYNLWGLISELNAQIMPHSVLVCLYFPVFPVHIVAFECYRSGVGYLCSSHQDCAVLSNLS